MLYEEEEGLIRLQEVLKLQNLTEVNEFNTIMLRQLGDEAANNALFKEIKNSTEAQIVLDCHVDHVVGILRQADKFKMLDLFYSYFLTSLVSSFKCKVFVYDFFVRTGRLYVGFVGVKRKGEYNIMENRGY